MQSAVSTSSTLFRSSSREAIHGILSVTGADHLALKTRNGRVSPHKRIKSHQGMQDSRAVPVGSPKLLAPLVNVIALLLLARYASVGLAIGTSHLTGQICNTGTIRLV